jgi:DNA-binding GntR family transcriptional regulator
LVAPATPIFSIILPYIRRCNGIFARCIQFVRYAIVFIYIRKYFGQAMRSRTAKLEAKSEAGHVRKKSDVGAGRKTLKLKRTGLHERAAARMRAMIIRGELEPGSPTQETKLSKALGVSRTPLREAMKLLAAEGLVELRPNRSPRIADIETDHVFELFEALAGIERLAAELAAQRATERDLQRLRLLQTRMESHHRDGRLDDYFAINGEIHGLIVRAARNAPLREAHETLLSRAERARYLALGAERRWSNSVEEHAAILAALEIRDGETAGRLLSAHVQRTGTALLEVLVKTTLSRPAA